MGETMNLKRIWLIALVVLALVAACGPAITTPVPSGQATVSTQAPTKRRHCDQDTGGDQVASAAPTQDPNDWRTLGSADAKITLIEYSDFQ